MKFAAMIVPSKYTQKAESHNPWMRSFAQLNEKFLTLELKCITKNAAVNGGQRLKKVFKNATLVLCGNAYRWRNRLLQKRACRHGM